jgi:hypothetical protein
VEDARACEAIVLQVKSTERSTGETTVLQELQMFTYLYEVSVKNVPLHKVNYKLANK